MAVACVLVFQTIIFSEKKWGVDLRIWYLLLAIAFRSWGKSFVYTIKIRACVATLWIQLLRYWYYLSWLLLKSCCQTHRVAQADFRYKIVCYFPSRGHVCVGTIRSTFDISVGRFGVDLQSLLYMYSTIVVRWLFHCLCCLYDMMTVAVI